MPEDEVGKFIRHFNYGSTHTGAYIVCHGSYENFGFTSAPSPAMVHFYVFHADPLYTVEIHQILHYRDRIRFPDGEVGRDLPKKQATSILGKGSMCWNYWLSAWNENQTAIFVKEWGSARGNENTDLIMLPAGVGGWISDAPNAYLNDLFEALKGSAYEKLFFCCCRSVKGSQIRQEPPSTKPLYKKATPYWS
jgi:hypothetical protein